MLVLARHLQFRFSLDVRTDLFQGIARTQSLTNINYAPESFAFGKIEGVSHPGTVQWNSLTLGEPPCGSGCLLRQVSMLDAGLPGAHGSLLQTEKIVCRIHAYTLTSHLHCDSQSFSPVSSNQMPFHSDSIHHVSVHNTCHYSASNSIQL